MHTGKKKSENERKKELKLYSGNQCRCKEVKRGGGDRVMN